MDRSGTNRPWRDVLGDALKKAVTKQMVDAIGLFTRTRARR